jgi:predicted metallopeptidase
MRWEPAPDLHARLVDIAATLGFEHVQSAHVHCARVFGARANAWARIWGLPAIFQNVLDLPASYVVEFLCPAFDQLPEDEQDRVLIHELLHIPRTFSGSVRPEASPNLRINRTTVNRYYRAYLKVRKQAEPRPSAQIWLRLR